MMEGLGHLVLYHGCSYALMMRLFFLLDTSFLHKFALPIGSTVYITQDIADALSKIGPCKMRHQSRAIAYSNTCQYDHNYLHVSIANFFVAQKVCTSSSLYAGLSR